MKKLNETVYTAVDEIEAPLVYRGKVREVYDLGEEFLLVVTDRISAHDLKLMPPIPEKGRVLNELSVFWFEKTGEVQLNHFVHADVDRLIEAGVIAAEKRERYARRVMVAKKAERIDIECVVRGYLTGNGWRQYEKTGAVNGVKLPEGLRKNQRLEEPIFTPAFKNDIGHDEDLSFEETVEQVGRETAEAIRAAALKLYGLASEFCEKKGVLLADCKLEFGSVDGELILIDECFTPDSSRFWAKERYELDVEIDSMDKEPVRQFLLEEEKQKGSMPTVLPDGVVTATTARYLEILKRITTEE